MAVSSGAARARLALVPKAPNPAPEVDPAFVARLKALSSLGQAKQLEGQLAKAEAALVAAYEACWQVAAQRPDALLLITAALAVDRGQLAGLGDLQTAVKRFLNSKPRFLFRPERHEAIKAFVKGLTGYYAGSLANARLTPNEKKPGPERLLLRLIQAPERGGLGPYSPPDTAREHYTHAVLQRFEKLKAKALKKPACNEELIAVAGLEAWGLSHKLAAKAVESAMRRSK